MADHVSKLVFYVNGKKVELDNPDPELTLLQVLRRKLKLVGTKLGCAEGGCGACTVMVSRYDREAKTIVHHSVNACLAPVCSMHGLAVTTVEGVGSIETGLHPVQEALARSHGSQCGFCTPGMVMSMYTLLRNNSKPALQDIEAAFEGNLCRCTGYRPILEGFRTFTKEYQCPMGDQCCKVIDSHAENGNGIEEVTSEWSTGHFTVYDPTQEAIFPSELQLSDVLDTQSLVFSSSRVTWYRPTTLKEVLALKHTHPDAKLVVGNTEVGVEVKFKNMHYPVRVAVGAVQELLEVEHTHNGVTVGASTSLTRLQHLLKLAIQEYPVLLFATEYQTRVFSGIVEMLRWFAGHQIRNVASVAGNIMTASPVSDLNPLFLAAGCQLNLISQESGRRTIVMDKDFFRGYRKTAVDPEEVVQSLFIPFTTKNEFFGSYKQARKRDDDIAIVNAGLRVKLQDRSSVIEDISLAFGGMAPVTVMAVRTMEQLRCKNWNDNLVPFASQLLAEELPLLPGVPGGRESYRRTLTVSFFFKFFLTVRIQQQEDKDTPGTPLISTDISATEQYHRGPSKATQIYEEVPDSQSKLDPVGRPIEHVSAQKQVTGQAIYVDDMPLFEDELHMALVVSSKAHAVILAVDTTDALMMPGVVDYLDHTDVPGSNVTGLFNDEEVFASKKGQTIGAILASSKDEAQRAAKAVKVTYHDLEPIITIEQAIANNSFLSEPRTIQNGNVEGGLADSDHIVEGEVKCGAQEHFYFETMACIGIPKEDNELEMFCSTQNPSQIQGDAARAVGVPANRVIVRVKRLGGGFGGKETRSALVSTPVAVAAMKHKRPVRCVLDRDEDIVMTGTRHAFLGRYKIGFNSDGKIKAANIELYSNCGHSKDLSLAVLDWAMLHVDNCYNVPNVCVTGYACKTNIPSATAFRGFGSPQSMFICETYMTAIAEKLGVRPEEIRKKNLYVDGDRTHLGQLLENCNIARCWKQVVSSSQWQSRLQTVQQFNRENRWKKRGMAIVPVKFGICYSITFFNQGGALVHIYTDGSVLVTHGGTEMGQGLHTKMMQIASRVLNVDISKIHISETSTASVPNSVPTAGSMSSDLYGPAVMDACQTLADRLQPYQTARPEDRWEDWVMAAYKDRVQLSATGFFKELGINQAGNKGPVFAYFTTGAGGSEVEIDCLTGDHTVLRSDIVMDLGKSLNPVIDIGQIEGAFVQGYGWLTLEDHRYSPTGFIYTRGPGTYKIPGFTDIPVELNVSLLKGSSNPRAVYSSKAVGEPPFFIGASVFFAIRDAIAAARLEVGLQDSFRLDGPATAERIRLACQDQFTQQFPEPEPGTYTPWTVSL